MTEQQHNERMQKILSEFSAEINSRHEMARWLELYGDLLQVVPRWYAHGQDKSVSLCSDFCDKAGFIPHDIVRAFPAGLVWKRVVSPGTCGVCDWETTFEGVKLTIREAEKMRWVPPMDEPVIVEPAEPTKTVEAELTRLPEEERLQREELERIEREKQAELARIAAEKAEAERKAREAAEEAERLAHEAKTKPSYELEIHQQLTKLGSDLDNESGIDEDEEIIQQCIEVIRSEQKASVSLLQRRLRLGYGRAARIMDELENRGIVGPSKGAEPRDIFTAKQNEPRHRKPFDSTPVKNL